MAFIIPFFECSRYTKYSQARKKTYHPDYFLIKLSQRDIQGVIYLGIVSFSSIRVATETGE